MSFSGRHLQECICAVALSFTQPIKRADKIPAPIIEFETRAGCILRAEPLGTNSALFANGKEYEVAGSFPKAERVVSETCKLKNHGAQKFGPPDYGLIISRRDCSENREQKLNLTKLSFE